MKNSTKIILAAGFAALSVVDLVMSIKTVKNDVKSVKTLNSRINVLTTPSHGSRKLAEELSASSVKKSVAESSEPLVKGIEANFGNMSEIATKEVVEKLTPLCKDMFELGYTTGRRDEIIKRAICVEGNNELIEEYFDNM